MAIKKYKPTTNGRRGMSTLANTEITTSTPEKSLLVSKNLLTESKAFVYSLFS